MPFLLKLFLTNVIIIVCARIGSRYPTLGGLIATMPLTSLIVLLWIRLDNPGNPELITSYTRGVLWGIIPTTLFFAVTYLCIKNGVPLALALSAASAMWLVAAVVHQWLV